MEADGMSGEVAQLQSGFEELLGAITSTIQSGASRDEAAASSRQLGQKRESFLAACNKLLDELVVLRQIAAQGGLQAPSGAADQQQQSQGNRPPAAAGDVISMDVDDQKPDQKPDQQQLAAALAQQQRRFLQQLSGSRTAPDQS